MITALAAETLSVSLLAWMSIQASVTLAAILTVILVPWALLTARKAPVCTALAVALVGMTWRGEAWKTVFLQSEQRVSELQRQLRRPISSNTEWLNPDSLIRCVADFRVLSHASAPFLVEEFEVSHRHPEPGIPNTPLEQNGPRTEHHKALGEPQVLDLEGLLAGSHPEPGYERRELRLGSQIDFSLFDLPMLGQSDPTPIDFI